MFRLSASMRLAMTFLTRDLVEPPEQAGDEVETHDDDDQGERGAPHPIYSVVVDRLAGERVLGAEVGDLVVDHARQRGLEAVAEQVAVRGGGESDQDQQ